MTTTPCCSEEPLPLLPHTAFARRFFIVASSSAGGHPIEKGYAELKDSAKRSKSIFTSWYHTYIEKKMQQSSTIELGPHHRSSAAAAAYKNSDDEEEQQTLLSSSTVSSSSAAGLRRRSIGRNHQRGSWSHYGGKIYYFLLQALAVVGIAAIVSPFLSYSKSVVDRVALSSSNNTTDVVEVKALTKDDIKQQQIANYIKGTAIIQNIHITHHAGTSVCHQMARLGPTPGFACMGKGKKGNATLEHPWPSDEALETSHIGLNFPEYNDTAAWVTFWRPYFHFMSKEYSYRFFGNLHKINWEYENLVSMIVMR